MKQKYCLPIIKNNSKDVLKIISENKNSYDSFELWLDYISDVSLDFIEDLIKNFDGKIIFLFRRQGLAAPKMTFQKRMQLISTIADSHCLLDLDISQRQELELVKGLKKIRLIVSYHNYKQTPSQQKLETIIQDISKYNPEIIKISTFCSKNSDAHQIMDLQSQLNEKKIKHIILGMGEKGVITRIAGAITGNEMNFTPLSRKDVSAGGQLVKSNLEKILKKIKICYFVADPVEHSLSPQMHNAGYKALGIENDFIYLRQLVKPEDLKSFIDKAKMDPNFKGASISIPHKIKIIKYLDSIDAVAGKIGAVNTVVKIGKKLKGYNTDYLGILNPLKKHVPILKNKYVAILGAGGAAKAAVYALVTQGAQVTIFNRNLEKAKDLARDFNCQFDSLKNLSRIGEFDIVINTTSVGLDPTDHPLLSKNQIKLNQIIFDIVYSKKHAQTKLIKQAIQQKAKVIAGTEMLTFQGVAQFKLFTNKNISVEEMGKTL